MAIETRPIIEVVKRYIEELGKNQIPIVEAILFGAHTKGTASSEGNIDVAIISDAFSGDRFEDRRRIVPFRRRIDNRIEPIPFKREDFNDGGTLAEEIKRAGITIFKK